MRVEAYAHYVNKIRQNVGLEKLLWRQIVTSQTAHTKYKWPHMPLNEHTHENFLRTPLGESFVKLRRSRKLYLEDKKNNIRPVKRDSAFLL